MNCFNYDWHLAAVLETVGRKVSMTLVGLASVMKPFQNKLQTGLILPSEVFLGALGTDCHRLSFVSDDVLF